MNKTLHFTLHAVQTVYRFKSNDANILHRKKYSFWAYTIYNSGSILRKHVKQTVLITKSILTIVIELRFTSVTKFIDDILLLHQRNTIITNYSNYHGKVIFSFLKHCLLITKSVRRGLTQSSFFLK